MKVRYINPTFIRYLVIQTSDQQITKETTQGHQDTRDTKWPKGSEFTKLSRWQQFTAFLGHFVTELGEMWGTEPLSSHEFRIQPKPHHLET